MSNTEKVVIYFPWLEVSGGPIYLVRLAEELAKDGAYSVYYVDYEDGFSNQLISSESVTRLTVTQNDFSIPFEEPITIITPIYFACWLPELHPQSKLLFVNWHICSIPALQNNWQTSDENIYKFLSLVHETNSVIFCDESHRLGQNTKDIDFDKNIVPITLSRENIKAKEGLVNSEEINIAILGRLCQDKIYSVINVLDNLQPLDFNRKKIVHIIGDGPDRNLIDVDSYPSIDIKFVGTLVQQEMRKYLAVKCDCLFAMGTSVLEGAAISLPSIIIAHNMKPMTSNSYVYIQDTPGYCLGWYDDQFDDLGLKPITMQNILEDLLICNSKSSLGELGFRYFSENHTIENAVIKFKNAIRRNTLTSNIFTEKTRKFQNTIRSVSVAGLDLITFDKTLLGIDAKVFGKIKSFSLRNDEDPRWKIVSIFNLDLFRISKTKRFYKASFLRSKFDKIISRIESGNIFLQSELNALKDIVNQQHRFSVNDSKDESIYNMVEERILAIETRVFEKLDRIHYDSVIEMDTCDKLLSRESLEYFRSDIDQAYKSLTNGLDSKSLEIVNRIINRIQSYMNNSTSLFLMTDYEIDEYTKMIEFHSAKLVKINDEKYIYGKYQIPIDIITSTVFYYDCFMPELKRLEEYRNKHIIDAGGSFGDSALVLSEYTDKQVHVFEPTEQMYNLATKTLEYNDLESSIVLNKTALGDVEESLEIKIEKDFSTFCFNSGANQDVNTELVNVETLDGYVERNALEVGVIKVDVEGFEEKLLDGAVHTIKKYKPALIISIYHSAEQFFWIKQKIESLNLGYTFKIRKPLDRSIIVDTMLIAEVSE